MQTAPLAPPSFSRTVMAVVRGYAPRVLQARGWILAALVMGPVGITLGIAGVIRAQGGEVDPTLALSIFHGVLALLIIPIMALLATSAGIREDLEQQTLPLLLTRPAPPMALPLAKGLLWFGWGALWLLVGTLALLPLGAEPAKLGAWFVAILATWWAELGALAAMTLYLKRGSLWSALYLFIWEAKIAQTGLLPGFLQRLTLSHHRQMIAGSAMATLNTSSLLAQAQVQTPAWISFLALLGVGVLGWALAGWKLYRTPIGLAGVEAEG